MHNATHFLGIDGGGTSCRARICNSDGAVLAEATGGAANIYQDFAGALQVLLATATACATQAGVAVEILCAGIGLAGVTDARQSARVAAAGLPFRAIKVESDAYIACLGAHGGADGGIVIAGTGSAGLALVEGERIHIGGHGFVLGDHGSGAIIGRAGLCAAILAADGLKPQTKFTEDLMAQFDNNTAKMVDWSRSALSRDYAKFAPHVLRAAGNHDPIAQKIVTRAIDDLAAIARRLQTLGAPRLSLIGGLGAALFPFFEPEIAAMFASPLGDPMDGAIAMVQK